MGKGVTMMFKQGLRYIFAIKNRCFVCSRFVCFSCILRLFFYVQKLQVGFFVLCLLLFAACTPPEDTDPKPPAEEPPTSSDEDKPSTTGDGVSVVSQVAVSPVKEGASPTPSVAAGALVPVKRVNPCPECVTPGPSPSVTDVKSGGPTPLQKPGFVCSYPAFLKQALGRALKKPCADIKAGDIHSVTYLRLVLPEGFSPSAPVPVSHFKNIKTLDLSGNTSLSGLPDFVTGLKTLVTLDISATGIQDLHSNICRLNQLRLLMAGDNTYKNNEPPRALFCLKQLRALDLSNSQLVYVDEELFNLWELRELYLQNNRLVTEPVVLSYMPNLDIIDLRGNRIKNAQGVLNAEMNRLHDCHHQPKESRQDCKNDLRYHLRCRGGWFNPFPHRRKEPFREMFKNYHNMNEGEYQEFLKSPQNNRCYMYWLNTEIGDAYSDPSSPLLEKTINGKTIREWRLFHEVSLAWWHVHNRPSDYWNGQMCFFEKYGSLWKGIKGAFMGSRDVSHMPLSVEKHTERFLDPTMEKPPLKDCPGLKGR